MNDTLEEPPEGYDKRTLRQILSSLQQQLTRHAILCWELNNHPLATDEQRLSATRPILGMEESWNRLTKLILKVLKVQIRDWRKAPGSGDMVVSSQYHTLDPLRITIKEFKRRAKLHSNRIDLSTNTPNETTTRD